VRVPLVALFSIHQVVASQAGFLQQFVDWSMAATHVVRDSVAYTRFDSRNPRHRSTLDKGSVAKG